MARQLGEFPEYDSGKPLVASITLFAYSESSLSTSSSKTDPEKLHNPHADLRGSSASRSSASRGVSASSALGNVLLQLSAHWADVACAYISMRNRPRQDQ